MVRRHFLLTGLIFLLGFAAGCTSPERYTYDAIRDDALSGIATPGVDHTTLLTRFPKDLCP